LEIRDFLVRTLVHQPPKQNTQLKPRNLFNSVESTQ
jgi:hypothetical protein